jgi:predicted enzyme related to lactoylglutathione lyase
MSIQFTDVCFITEDVHRLCTFYKAVFDGSTEGNEFHSTLVAGGITFTFDYVVPLLENSAFHYVSASGANNVIVGFNVDDVDAEYKRLLPLGIEMLNQPITHPWGARSFQFKDPDGNILNFRSFPKEK